jgi:hypothetical protein
MLSNERIEELKVLSKEDPEKFIQAISEISPDEADQLIDVGILHFVDVDACDIMGFPLDDPEALQEFFQEQILPQIIADNPDMTEEEIAKLKVQLTEGAKEDLSEIQQKIKTDIIESN